MSASRFRLRQAAVICFVVWGVTVAGTVPSAGAATFPLRLKAANGTVLVPSRPTRIVSLSPTATDDLYAIGALKQVVAVDSDSTYPKQAPHTTLSAYSPNVEAIERYHPDLVVISFDENHIQQQLQTLHVPVLVEPAATDLAGVYAEIDQLGEATGHLAGARSVVGAMRKQIAAIVASVKRPTKPLSVYIELEPDFYSASSHTFMGQVLSLLGLRSIADKAATASNQYPQLSDEYIVAANPDVIVLADTVCCGQSAKTVAARSGWGSIAAVKSGAIVPVNDSIASQWGPLIVRYLKQVAAAVSALDAHTG